ncbi:MAG: site-specific DNA-methyltransferase [Bacteroidetes bacterium]|nr:site-specific DNA-methyltransferase [Bacteroidota bacterium]
MKTRDTILTGRGKSDAFRVLQQRTSGTLRPMFGEGVNDVPAWRTHPPALPIKSGRRGEETERESENVFIEGENLEVLKILQKSYFGKIKMIYIDPPYNTGSDSFIYPDKFSETKDEYLKRIGDKDEEGFLLREGFFRKNSKESGHYHSNWLSMMYPRLYTARNLLRDDGVIFVSIDDNEVHNLRMIMNEIFGEENFLASIIWQKKYAASNDAKGIATMHDYILVYQKSYEFERNLFPRTEKQDSLYKYDDNDGKGLWRSDNLLVKSFQADYVFPIKNPNTGKEYLPPQGSCWRASKDTIEKWIEDNRIFFGRDGKGAPQLKRHLNEVQQGIVPTTWWSFQEAGHNDEANKELKKLFETKAPFDTPKPSRLIKRILQLSTIPNDNDIILDFFSGSGTTAQAVMELNKEDGGNRKFILVQLPEKTDESSEAYKAKYFTIADICKERIRRVINRLNLDSAGLKDEQDESQKSLFNNPGNPKIPNNPGSDNGFKVFKLAPSNFKMWRSDVIETEDDLNKMVDLFDTQIKPDAKKENMLYELMLKSGFTLTDKVEKINGYYSVNHGQAVFVLDKIDQNIVDAIIKLKPQSCIILDDLFAGNDQLKTNTALQMKDAGVELSTV